MRIKFIKNYKDYQKGQLLSLPHTEASALIGLGVAIATKDMVSSDMRTA